MKRFRTILSMFLVCALMAAVTCLPACAAANDTGYSGYSDVEAGAWYADAVEYCTEQGLMSGTGQTGSGQAIFSPETSASRAMVVSVLYQQAGRPAVNGPVHFTDVQAGEWYADAVSWAVNENIVSGYGNGLFGTEDPVTREQLAAILWHIEGSPAPGGAAGAFRDAASISAYAADAVMWAQTRGIVSGREAGRFDPQGGTTRAELAAVLFHWLNGESGNEAAKPNAPETTGKVLVAYFSRTGTTKGVAETVAELTGGGLFELVPENAYPADYNECLERARQEQSDNARPALKSHVEEIAQYDVICLGFPIWHGDAPMAVRTFLEEYDMTGKIIAPFSTSGSSGIDSAVRTIRGLCPEAEVTDGLSIPSSSMGQADTSAAEWVDRLSLRPENKANTAVSTAAAVRLKITVGTAELYADVEDNAAARDFLTMLPMTQNFSDYNGTEKISYLSRSLASDNGGKSYDPEPGDLCYFAPWGNLCFFYRDFTASSDLIPIAHLSSGAVGIDTMAGISDNTPITIEAVPK